MKTNQVTQVAAFDKVLGFCNDQKAVFNPSNSSIKITALSVLLAQAQKSSEAVKTAKAAFDTAVIARRQAYEELPKLATRIVRTLASTKASRDIVEKANASRQQLTGAPNAAKPKTEPAPSATAPENQAPLKKYSKSKLAFDQVTDTFEALIQTLAAEPLYVPNEVSLQVASLKTLLASLKAKSAAVNKAKEALRYTRDERRRLLYSTDGIYGTAMTIKNYAKGLFGPKSDTYKHISSILFIKARYHA